MTPARRRVLRGGLFVAPVVAASAPRSAMAGVLPIRVPTLDLVNACRPDLLVACAGKTPDYWEQDQNFRNWPSQLQPIGKDAVLFNSVFPGSTGYPGKTLLDVLKMGASTAARDVVARHVVAALLNAGAGLTRPNVLGVAAALQVWSSFDRLGYVEPTVGIRWYADGANVAGTGSIIQWLKSTMSA